MKSSSQIMNYLYSQQFNNFFVGILEFFLTFLPFFDIDYIVFPGVFALENRELTLKIGY